MARSRQFDLPKLAPIRFLVTAHLPHCAFLGHNLGHLHCEGSHGRGEILRMQLAQLGQRPNQGDQRAEKAICE
jgi:hypothetical protein